MSGVTEPGRAPTTTGRCHGGALDEALDVVTDFSARYLVVSAGFDIAAGGPVGGF